MIQRDIIMKRAGMLREFAGERMSAATREVIERARDIASGTVFFYSNIPVKVALRDIDWSGGHIRHQEWPAQLNRFGYLAILAAAWKKTRDGRFAAAARAYVEDWIARGGSYETSGRLRAGDNTLSLSIRLGSSVHAGWGGTLPQFLDSAAFDDAFVARVLASIESQAAYLSRHLSARGNWRIAHLDALVFTALRFPFLASAKRLLAAGLRGMRAALATQFLADGVHVERTPGYHAWMTGVAWAYLRLARLFPEADARVDPVTLARAFDYEVQSALSGFNDATTAVHEPRETPGLAERRRMLASARLGKRFGRTPPLEQVFPDAGQVFVRSSWHPGALSTSSGRRSAAEYLAFDAGTWGGAHSHLSRLAFTLRSGGRLLVADPGILSYEMSDPYGPYGKSTPAHSTLNIGGGNQSECDAKLMRAEFTRDVALIHAKYEGGYWPGEFGWTFREGHGCGAAGLHERVLFRVKAEGPERCRGGEYLLALDRMECDALSTGSGRRGVAGADVRNVWQLGPMDGWRMDAKRLAWRSTNRDVNLFLQLLMSPARARMKCYEGSRRPIRGWLGGHTGKSGAIPAPLVEFRYGGSGRPGAVSAVLLAPFRGKRPPDIRLLAARTHADGWIHSLELALPDGRRDFVAWSWHLELPVVLPGLVVTDAPFVWLRRDRRGKVVRSFSLRGWFAKGAFRDEA